MSYAIVSIFGQDRRLYRELLLKYMVSSKDKPKNHHIYLIDTNIGYTIFHNDLCLEEDDQNTSKDQQTESVLEQNNNEYEGVWNMDFDGKVNKEGAWAGV